MALNLMEMYLEPVLYRVIKGFVCSGSFLVCFPEPKSPFFNSLIVIENIYTCDPRSGYKAANNASDPLNKNTINSSNCNQPLFVNGPVIAKNLYLYRTGGGNGGASNATPSEIFYLGPEAYLWSYNQAQRYSQATTTYQREVAPRY